MIWVSVVSRWLRPLFGRGHSTHRAALELNRTGSMVGDGGVISAQVLNELTNVVRRKMRMTWPNTVAFLATLRGLLTVEAMTVETHGTDVAFAERCTSCL